MEREIGQPGRPALEQAERISSRRVNSVTHKMFWVLSFLTALAREEVCKKMIDKEILPHNFQALKHSFGAISIWFMKICPAYITSQRSGEAKKHARS
jgi:hypothetical protein